MRTQSSTSGVAARGTYKDLQQYDQKLKPSPFVPRKSLKKGPIMKEAFVRGFFDELEKNAALGGLARGAASLVTKAKPAAKWLGTKAKENPFIAYEVGKGALGGIKNRISGAPGQPKKVGLMGGLGLKRSI